MCATASPRGVGVEVGACCLGRASQQPTRRVAGWWTATQLRRMQAAVHAPLMAAGTLRTAANRTGGPRQLVQL
jgi:hypothetical protein